MLRVGAVLAGAGSIATPDDIFFLGIADVREALITGEDRRALVEDPRRAFERDRRLRPPRQTGAPPTAPAPSSPIPGLGYRVTQADPHPLRRVPAPPGRGPGP